MKSQTLPRQEPLRRRISARTLVGLAAALVLAYLVSAQVSSPNKRVLEAIAGLILVYVAYRMPPYWSLGFFILFYQFPFGLSLGTSNIIFVPIIFFMWLIRLKTGELKRVRHTILDLPIICLATSYILSFYNIPDDKGMIRHAILNTGNFFSAVFIFYLCVNLVQDRRALEKTLGILAVSCALASAFAILELIAPGTVLIPNWLYLGDPKFANVLVVSELRVKGPIHDFELFAEYLAVNIIFLLFMISRAKNMVYKTALIVLEMVVIGLLFATATRGAFMVLVIGFGLMLWHFRKTLRFDRLVYIVSGLAAAFFVTGYIVLTFSPSSNIFERFGATTFQKGIPDTRTRAWPETWERIKDHPIIGHSPTWDIYNKGLGAFHWPHSVYLFYWYIGGILALLSYLFLLYRLFKHSRKWMVNTFGHPSYPRAAMTMLYICLIMFMIDQIKIDYIRNSTYTYFVWIFFGLIAAATRICEHEQKEAELNASTAPASE